MKNFKSKIKRIIEKIDKKDLVIFLIPFLSFLFYLIIFYPGALSYDSYNQLRQISTFSFNSSHPFFHTYIEMILLFLFKTPASIGMMQILFFSLLWTKICKYNRSKKDDKKSFILEIIVSFIIGFNPLNGIMSIVLWKDVLFSYVILWITFLLQKFIDKHFKLNKKDIILVSLLLVISYNLRYNGLVVLVFVTILLLIILFIKDRKSKNYIYLLLLTVFFFFSFNGLNVLFKVKNLDVTSKSESVIESELLTMIGNIGREGNITKEEQDEINKFVSYDKLLLHARYNLHDAIVVCDANYEYITKHRSEFFTLLFNIIKENKAITLKYILKENSFIWSIVRLDDSYGYIIKYDSNAPNSYELYYKQIFENTRIYNLMSNYLEFSIDNENKILQTIFYSGSLYLYIIIICSILLKKYGKSNLIILSPLIVIYGGLILTMPVNDVRYYYMTFLIAYYYLVLVFTNKKDIKNVSHTFVIPAYKESKYLEECILSLKNQTVKTNILITTSTPNKFISSLSKKYDVKLIINKDKPDIGKDFDFALNSADTILVTIAHQDDVYDNDYAEKVINAYNNYKNPIIIFTNYYEVRNNKKVKYNSIMIVKRILLGIGGIKGNFRTRIYKRKSLMLGDPICCPSVTFVKKNIPEKLFESDFKCNVDWQAWEKLSRMKGTFVSIHKRLMGHRIHEESETTKSIRLNIRKNEDLKMFEMFWPKPIAKILGKFYSRSENSNKEK